MNKPRVGFLYVIFFLSGIAGLGYEIAWTRIFAVGLGHEMPSMLSVIAAFFGGLALGAWAFDQPVSMSKRPGRWYASFEIVIGLWGLISLALIPWCNDLALRLIGLEPTPWRHWVLSFAIPFLALMPATTAMGATLPAMERLVSRLGSRKRVLAGLYSVNTLGAVTGVVVSTWILIPAGGYRAPILIFAAVNFLCAAFVLMGAAQGEEQRQEISIEQKGVVSPLRLYLTVFMTGVLGIAYEVLGVRVMAQVLEDTVYSFAAALSVYLTATAIGASIYQRFADRAEFKPVLTALLTCISISCLFGIIVLSESLNVYEWFREMYGGNAFGSIAAEMSLALCVFGLPATFMGATFSHLVQAARRMEGGIGSAAGFNTLGGAIAPAIFGVMMLPKTGAALALALVSVSYLILVPQFTKWTQVGLVIPLLMLLTIPRQLELVDPPEGGEVVEYREGVMAAVAVVRDDVGGRFLKVNNRFTMGGIQQGNPQSSFGERRSAHIPLLLHENPRNALFLGVGTGITIGSSIVYQNLFADGAELVPEVLDVMHHFEPFNNSPLTQPSIHLYVTDARRYVRSTDETYDVIIGDLFHPARDGAGTLYTLEHFQAIKELLNPGGLFCQWLSLYQIDDDMTKVIVRTFLEAFPHARAFIAHFNVDTPMLGIVGTLEPTMYDVNWYDRVVKEQLLRETLHSLDLENGIRLFGCLVADQDDLVEYSMSAAINTDNHPIVIYGAPKFTYSNNPTRYGRMMSLIEHSDADVSTMITMDPDSNDDDEFVERVRKYMSARNRYLDGMVALNNGREHDAVNAFVDCTRLSEDFNTGYAMCLVFAEQRLHQNLELNKVREVLQEISKLRPNDPRAGNLLKLMPK